MSYWVRYRRKGQSMVEFVVVLPSMLLLILGVIAALQIITTQDTVAQAARAAAHQAALLGGSDGANGSIATAPGRVAEAARSILSGAISTNPERATIAVVCRNQSGQVVAQCRRYYPITVTIAYNDLPWAPIPPLFTEVRAQISATRVAEQDQQ